MERSEIPHDPCYLGVPSRRSKWFPSLWYVWRKLCTYRASGLALSPKWLKQASIWASSPCGAIECIQNNFRAYGMSSTNHTPIFHRHWHCLQTETSEIPHDPRHLGVPSGKCKMISKPMVRSMHTMHYFASRLALSPNGLSFHLSLSTSGYRRVSPNWFLSRWYIWCKPCTDLAPTVTLSPKREKWDSTWPTSPKGSIGCVQNDFWANGTFHANRAPILHQDYHYLLKDRNEVPLEPRHLVVPSGVSKMISEPMVCLGQTMHLSCTDTNTVS
jgi:hypothetical protein